MDTDQIAAVEPPRCPYCRHIQCEACSEEPHPRLWLGCCKCGLKTVEQLWTPKAVERLWEP